MLFNSIDFIIFLPIVFALYWIVPANKPIVQNFILLISGYFFYGCWDYRFLFLLAFSTLLDFFSGQKIASANTIFKKKCWLWLSIVINIGFLAVFKYYDFFASSLAALFAHAGIHIDLWLLHIILPVGISFYTFHGLSYVLDIFYERTKPTKNIITYASFISFFPLLVAGPIERATHLLPQLEKKRIFNYQYAIDGLKQILWGFFKKIVIADTCAQYANLAFTDVAHYNGSTLVMGAIFFSIQIYGDFSGYSDIAIGTAKLFGIEVMRNFNYPYFSRDIAEFWRRWHISLSSWFKDYVYIPLGGSKGTKSKIIFNVFLIFFLSGLWHGANVNFIIWGLLHAAYFLPLLLFKKNRENLHIADEGKTFPSLKNSINIFITFCLVTFAWIFFRSPNLPVANKYIATIFSGSFFSVPDSMFVSVKVLVLIAFFFFVEWSGREQHYAIARTGFNLPRPARLVFYYALLMAIFYFAGQQQKFIYFQF